MKKHLLPSLALLSLASVAKAQVRFSAGPQVGYHLTTINYTTDNRGVAIETSYTSGFAAGLAAEIGFGHLVIQPTVQFAQKGYDQTGTSQSSFVGFPPIVTSVHVRFNYLAVPLNVAYTQHRNGQGAQVFAGPYLGVLLGGHYTAETTQLLPAGTPNFTQAGKIAAAEHYSPDVTNPNDTYYVRRLDPGVQVGLGYRYQGLLVQASYSVGLRNLQPRLDEPYASAGYSEPRFQNRAFLFSLAYLFGPKS